MWQGIAANVLFKLIEMFLGRYAKQTDVQAKFFEFVRSDIVRGMLPVEMRDSYAAQGEKNKEEIAKLGG